MKGNTGIALFGATLLIAIVLGALTPAVVPYEWLVEGGVIENVTVVFYGIAILIVLATTAPNLGGLDKAAICILLAACAARELDLHSAMFGTSILKARFYNRDGTAGQIAVALMVLAPVFLSIGWLVKRYARGWWPALRRHSPVAISFGMFVLALVVSKSCDRAYVTVQELTGVTLSQGVFHVLQAVEECLEMMLPAFVALAVRQAARPSAATPLGGVPRAA